MLLLLLSIHYAIHLIRDWLLLLVLLLNSNLRIEIFDYFNSVFIDTARGFTSIIVIWSSTYYNSWVVLQFFFILILVLFLLGLRLSKIICWSYLAITIKATGRVRPYIILNHFRIFIYSCPQSLTGLVMCWELFTLKIYIVYLITSTTRFLLISGAQWSRIAIILGIMRIYYAIQDVLSIFRLMSGEIVVVISIIRVC